jgi:hypothetical protein
MCLPLFLSPPLQNNLFMFTDFNDSYYDYRAVLPSYFLISCINNVSCVNF